MLKLIGWTVEGTNRATDLSGPPPAPRLIRYQEPMIPMDILLVIILLLLAVWIGSLIHCIRNPKLSSEMRIIGVIILVGLGVFGIFIYPFLPRQSNSIAREKKPIQFRRTSKDDFIDC